MDISAISKSWRIGRHSPIHSTSLEMSEVSSAPYSTPLASKREVPRDVRNSKVRRQDKFRRDGSRQ